MNNRIGQREHGRKPDNMPSVGTVIHHPSFWGDARIEVVRHVAPTQHRPSWRVSVRICEPDGSVFHMSPNRTWNLSTWDDIATTIQSGHDLDRIVPEGGGDGR